MNCRLKNTSLERVPLTLKLREYMPHFTPAKPDTIVYATVEEAQSATKEDIRNYLCKLKADLNISGIRSCPMHIILAGDQQTYSIVVELRNADMARFGWFHRQIHPFPGN